MGNVFNNVFEPQCGQGRLLLGDDGESSLAARYETDLFPQKLGEGQFSSAYVCWNKNSAERFALKVFVAATEGADHAANEIRVLHALGQHPRIIHLVDVYIEDPRSTRLVLELCEGGQLFDRLVSLGRFEEPNAAYVVQEILEAVAYMHNRGIMHRDLKPENILMVSPDSDDIKVCDFGIAKMAVGKISGRCRPPRANSFKGSDFYLAPEMIRQEEYGPEIDLWALGVTCYSLISGCLPFVGDGPDGLRGTYRKIVNRDIHFEGEAWEDASPLVVEFILQLLCLHPHQRLTAAQALAHDWVKCACPRQSQQESDEESDESDLAQDELEDEGGPPPGCIWQLRNLSSSCKAMSQRKAVYAARFLRPPGWTKRLLLREKPRELTGPFENPVRRWVRLREKARQFSELPPPRRVPVPKPSRKSLLQAVEGVPRVHEQALQRRLDFLLSEDAVKQQLAAPLRYGLSPYFVEFQCWSRQLRDLRRIYRAQYLQKLAEVTEIERVKEAELYKKEQEIRKERREAHLQRIGEDMKRRAILRDRKRIESKVNEAIQMARVSKMKRQRIFWLRRMETLSKPSAPAKPPQPQPRTAVARLVVSSENLEEAFAPEVHMGVTASSGVLLSRNVSIPYLLRQFGGSKTDPPQKNRRIPGIDNIQREVLQMSYEILGEDEERFESAPEASWQTRAQQLYSDSIFDREQKMALLNQKIRILQDMQEPAADPSQQTIRQKLIDELMIVKAAEEEKEKAQRRKELSDALRGKDPKGLDLYEMSIAFAEPSRLSAGFYQSLVLSNEVEEAGDGERPSSCVYSFGSNRNSLQAVCRPGVPGNAPSAGRAGGPSPSAARRDGEGAFVAEPTALDLENVVNVVQVSCGGNHSCVLEKRPGEEGGQVWTWGLGNGGRLGVKRPRKASEVQALLKNSKNFDALLADKAYVQWLTSDGKWSLHTPVKLQFGTDRIASISAGTDYTLALTENGAIYAWGIGSYGNLGTGLICDQWTPALVQMPENVRCCQVAAGTKHSMALTTAGEMFSWGHGGHGRLGHGPACEAALRPTRIQVEKDPRFKFVAVGEAHSACIDALGSSVWCWGAGSFGRCGHGEEADNMYPKQVSSMIGKSCSQVALGVCHSLALVRGSVWSWGGFLYTGHGENDDIETARVLEDETLGHSGRIVEVAAGRFHSLALSATGEVFSWGSGSLGRLGHPHLEAQTVPLQIFKRDSRDARDARDSKALIGWVPAERSLQEEAVCRAELQLACGGMHSAAVSSDGSCWLWGHGEYGQNASNDDLWKPSLLSAIDPISRSKIKVLRVALGMEHSLLISTTLELYSWGRNHRGQLGLGTTTDTSEPTFVAALSKASAVAAGEDHSAAITPGGEVYTWGNAECGKLGHGSSMIRSAMSFPKQINLEARVRKVSCGPTHTALIGNNGELFTCGAGWFGRLGHGDMDNQYSPKQVDKVLVEESLKECPRFLEVTCGSFHTCALCEGSRLWVFGRDYLVCEADHINSPLLFKHIEGEIVSVVAGANHTLCITRQGRLWGWGDNSKGQLGIGSAEKATATVVPFKGQLQAVSCGYAHSMAITNGEVWAWGLQSGGRLALKSPVNTKVCLVPQRVLAPWKESRK
ncbi:unnamed protein product [Effrenium voratum]|uniref:Protein kinase domain-containing protein n=1 Tax=Effrenium voratum TaxID=2562239 RepID=A0AA36NDS8_9DINO|nr:unnamed protein product [Effrenium voratum]